MGGASVLIVEPNPGIMIVGRNVLTRAGFEVHAVAAVEEGLSLAGRLKIDVVLLDGRISEPELLMAFARVGRRGVPIILTVQRGMDVLTIEALEDGGWSGVVDVAEVIEKPFSPEGLLRAVGHALTPRADRTEPYFELRSELFRLGELSADFEFERTERSVALRPPSRLRSRIEEESEVTLSGSLRAQNDGEAEPLSRRLERLLASMRLALRKENVHLEPRLLLSLARAAEDAFACQEQAQESAAMSGRLGQVGLDHLLQLTASVSVTSRLVLEQSEQRIEIFFEAGNIVFARQSNLPAAYTLGRVLVAAGAVTQRDIEKSLSNRGAHLPIGKRLLALGLVRPKDVSSALMRQTEELVYEALRWGDGRFAVISSDSLPPEAVDAGVCLPVHHLLLEGMRRLDELRRIAKEVGDLGAIIRRMERTTEREILESLPTEERMILDHIDGQLSIRDLALSSERSIYDVVRAVHSLRGQRLVTVVYPHVD